MIAVDTSALMAILLNESQASACIEALAGAKKLLISAGTVAEALIVAAHRNCAPAMVKMLDGLGFEIINVTPAAARRIATAHAAWGKGVHPAGLNFGDCFAYEVAKEHNCPLLYVGNNVINTDIASGL